MKTRILSILKNLNINDYLIEDTETSSIELFFIRKTIDNKRRKNVHHFRVTVYNDFIKDHKQMRGFSSVNIFTTMTDTELSDSLRAAYHAASFVCNPAYELPKGETRPLVYMASDLSSHTIEENCREMTLALFAEDKYEDVFLNSAELFLNETICRVTTSSGTDVSYKKWTVTGEFVTQCKLPQDVETYQSFKYNTLNTKALIEKVHNALMQTKARAFAKTAPAAGKYRIIISGQYMRTLFNYYLDRASSTYIFAKYSSFELGTKVQGEEVTGDKLSIMLKAEEPYSNEGIPMLDRPLLEDGTLKTIHGGVRFAYYLGIEPTGNYTDIKVAPGNISYNDMKKAPYLHIVNFSDFQMDSFTGHFGGEIRLAFLYDGEKEIPVTGGSINGNILDVHSHITLSSETQVEEGYEGPFAVCFENISVAGSD